MLSLLAATLLLASSADASVILQYATAGSTSTLSPVIADPGIAADDLQAGTGIVAQTFSTFNFNDWDTDNTSFADAVADDEVWTWGFDVTSPLDLNLTTLDVRLDRSSTGPDDFEIQASVNGGTPVSVLTFDFGDSSAGVEFEDVDLSGLGTLSTGDSVVFTLAAFNSETTGGTFDLETFTFPGGNDALIISGVFVIPEPGTVLLTMLGLTSVGVVGMRTKLG
ncbi:MAG: PEP-CTERM sorting domain-containing protein [Bacteroidota bacterium]